MKAQLFLCQYLCAPKWDKVSGYSSKFYKNKQPAIIEKLIVTESFQCITDP